MMVAGKQTPGYGRAVAILCALALFCTRQSTAFLVRPSIGHSSGATIRLSRQHAVPILTDLELSHNGAASVSSVSPLMESALTSSKAFMVDSSMMLAETDAWVAPVATVLDPTLNFLAFAMLCRVVISWYPNQKVNEFPFNVVAWPTEPLLKLIRGAIPPAFGVDITPIVWFGVFTFCHEIFLGQQGLFTMKIKYGM
jgi:YggT family protein